MISHGEVATIINYKTWTREKIIKIFLYGLLLITPFIAVIILGITSETSIFNLDAYSTVWNDELGYMRAVRIIRKIGIPGGGSKL